jgi:hypothetical protein
VVVLKHITVTDVYSVGRVILSKQALSAHTHLFYNYCQCWKHLSNYCFSSSLGCTNGLKKGKAGRMTNTPIKIIIYNFIAQAQTIMTEVNAKL